MICARPRRLNGWLVSMALGSSAVACGADHQTSGTAALPNTTDPNGETAAAGASMDDDATGPTQDAPSGGASTQPPSSGSGGSDTGGAGPAPSSGGSENASGGGPGTPGEACGSAVCAAGDVCCNASCGICTPPGGVCIQLFCEPPEPAGGACNTAADCRLVEDYCTGCDCRSLAPSDPDPVCNGPGVQCFAPACLTRVAACNNGHCETAQAP